MVPAMLVASIVACRGVIGIEEQTFVPDGGAEGGTADGGTDTGASTDARGDVDLQGIVDECKREGVASCRACCGRELPSSFALLKGFAGPASGPCACAPDGGAPCSQDCGGVQSVCVGSPPGPSTEAQCEACLLTNITSSSSCDGAESACNQNNGCRPLLTCITECNK